MTIDYTYDALNRLSSAAYSDGRNFSYTYDAAGNVLELQKNLGPGTVTTTYTYNTANELVTALQGGTTWQYTYDANGSLTEVLPGGSPANGAKRYTYNAAGKLVQMEAHNGSGWNTQAEMDYNGLGQRLGMDAAGVISHYVMDTSSPLSAGSDQPLTADSAGNTTFYLYGLGAIAEETNAWSYSLPDGTNTARQLSNLTGDITLSARYTPWGDTLDTSGTGNFTFGYFGGVMDAATGLLYVGNGQYYDAATGRFLTRDARPNQTNPYAPWNPIGAVVGPLGLLSMFYSRKKKGGKGGMFLVLLLVMVTAGMTLAACGGGTPAPTQGPTIPPAAETPIPIPSETPSQTPSPTEPSAPTNSPTQTPCPLPFTNDNSWGNSITQKEAHVQILIPVLSSYQGEKWWKGSYPTTEEWAGYLVYAEGEILSSREDKKLLAWILLYKIPRWGLAEYTPVTNPDVSTNFEMYNFTMNDWNKLINPDQSKLQDAFTILQETMLTHNSDELPPYLYWVSMDEIELAKAITKEPIKFDFNHYRAGTWDGKYLEFLAAYEDFAKVTSPTP